MNTYQSVITTPTALGADVTVNTTAKSFTVTGLPESISYVGLKSAQVLASVTQTLQVSTGTPTATASTNYQVVLSYTNKQTFKYETKIYSYDSDASATATEICDGFRALINADSQIVPIAATGTTTLILTAVTGADPAFAQFSVVTPSGSAGAIAWVTGTPAVVGRGLGLWLNQGATASSDFVNTTYYAQVIMDYTTAGYGTQAMSNNNVVNRAIVYVANASSGYATLVGTYGTLTQILVGKVATWIAQTNAGTHTYASGALTLVGGDVFFGATATCPLIPGDVLAGTTTSARTAVGSPGYVVLSGIKDNDEGYSASANITFTADVASYITLRDLF